MQLPRFRHLVLILSLVALGPAAPAAADPPPTKEEAAKAHYQQGAQLYKQADYAAAWLQFNSAYQLLPKPELLFNMARCEVRLNRPQDALAHFKAYLQAVPEDPDAAGIREEVAGLETEVANLKAHEAEHPREAPPRPSRPPSRPFPVYSTIAGAGTLVLAIVAVSLLGSIGPQYANLQQTCAPNCTPDKVLPLEQQATAGYVFLGLTAAGAATTAVLLSWELRRPRDAGKDKVRPQPALAPGALGLGWRF